MSRHTGNDKTRGLAILSGVGTDSNIELRTSVPVLAIRERSHTQLLERIIGVGDEFTKENLSKQILVQVQGQVTSMRTDESKDYARAVK